MYRSNACAGLALLVVGIESDGFLVISTCPWRRARKCHQLNRPPKNRALFRPVSGMPIFDILAQLCISLTQGLCLDRVKGFRGVYDQINPMRWRGLDGGLWSCNTGVSDLVHEDAVCRKNEGAGIIVCRIVACICGADKATSTDEAGTSVWLMHEDVQLHPTCTLFRSKQRTAA